MDAEQDSAWCDRIRKWLARTLDGDGIDRLVLRHDSGAEVATLQGGEGAPFECKESTLGELASTLAERD